MESSAKTKLRNLYTANRKITPVYNGQTLLYPDFYNPSNKNKKEDSCFIKTKRNIEEYLGISTLHGLKYIGDKTISYGERFFWFLSFGLAIVTALYFIVSIYKKYDRNPVIYTMNPLPIQPNEVPFPAVTICNMNQATRNISEEIVANGSVADKNFLEDLCDFEKDSVGTYDQETQKYSNFFKFIKKVFPSCSEVVKACKWHDMDIDCFKIFREVLTDEGVCCSFNQLPTNLILSQEPKKPNFEEKSLDFEVDDWHPERGYGKNASNKTFPFRSIGPGAHLGLTVVLDTLIDSYYCSSLNSAGFKVLLHTPIEIPKMKDFGFIVPPGFDSRIVYKPIIYDAAFSIRSIDISKRNCYFNNEKNLKFYRTYTEVNCKMECLTNTTIEICNCVPFYLPGNIETKTCGKLQDDCVDKVKQSMEISGDAGRDDHWCDCLPACFVVDYESTLSQGKFTGNFQIRSDVQGNVTPDYFVKNMAIIQIYFVTGRFTKYSKSELYGFSEFLSSTGGLLGLFLGFSSLSIVELVYHFSIRLFCIKIRANRKTKFVKKNFVDLKPKF